MALELLSGPNVVVNRATGQTVVASAGGRVLWLDPRGMFYERTEILLGRALIQMDGSLYIQGHGQSTAPGSFEPALVVRGGSLNDPSIGERTYGAVEVTLDTAARAWAWDPVALVESELLTSNAPAQSGAGLMVLPDRFIKLTGIRVQNSAGFGVPWSDEATLPFTGTPGMRNAFYVSWSDAPNEIWISNRLGQLARYDLDNRVVVGSVVETAVENVGLFYSRKHKVFVSLHFSSVESQISTRVWANTSRPVSLSAPTLTGSLNAGRSVPVQTRLLGAHSDPVADEVVAWSVTGDAALLQPSSKTDADGYARNTLLVAMDATGSVDVDVEAQV